MTGLSHMIMVFALSLLVCGRVAIGGMYTKSELGNFLKKRSLCYLAVGMLLPGPEFKSGEPNLGSNVVCL